VEVKQQLCAAAPAASMLYVPHRAVGSVAPVDMQEVVKSIASSGSVVADQPGKKV